MANAVLDQNSRPTLIAVSSLDSSTIIDLYADPVTHRLLVDIPSGGGTVVSVGVASANGLAGTVANPTTTPVITLKTTVTGLLLGDGTAVSAASTTGSGAVVLASGATLVNPALGTPSSVTLTNATGLPVATGISGLASGMSLFLSTPSSANLAATVTDETGSGSLVFATSPTLVTPVIGVATGTSLNLSGLTASQILSTDASKNLTSLDTATYPSLTELSYVKGVTSALQTQINAKGSGTVTAVSVSTANGISGSSSGGATPALTIALGAITPSTVNGNTFTTGTYTLTGVAGKTLTFNKSITLEGTDSTTMTFPTTTATIARTDAAQTFTGVQTTTQVLSTNNAITATSNAATVPVTSKINTVTNNSATTLTITLTTSGAIDGQTVIVRVLDFSNVAQTLTLVNTENSTVTAPSTTNGSTTLPLTLGFQFNVNTTKWRLIASA